MTRAVDFGPVALKAVRQSMIDEGLGRKSINQRINRIKHVYEWAVENGLLAPSALHGLQAVAGLRFGRSETRETEPIKPVPEAFIDLRPFAGDQIAARLVASAGCKDEN